jgi:hypothetical protein
MNLLMHSEVALELEQRLQARVGGRVRNLRVTHREGQTVLEGSSHSFYAKQLATQAMQEFRPTEEFVNDIVVETMTAVPYRG